MAALAATLWALNGSIARYLLDDGMPAVRLSQLRSLVSFLILLVAIGLARPALLRVRRDDVPRLAFIGVFGLAAVHATYFLAIKRLDIGVALTVEYLAPILMLGWLALVHGRRLRPGLWGAAALSVAGCALVVRAWDADALNGLGLLAAFGSTFAFAIALTGSERFGHRYEPATTMLWTFGFASLFWAVVQPLWSFPAHYVDDLRGVALGLGVAIIGTLLPFVIMTASLRHIPASRAGVVATLEPVIAAAIAWPVHHQILGADQIAGGLVVVAAVVWVQLHGSADETEWSPAPTAAP
jgi:drug/metabolite transporter (DMT)-like permease